MLRIFVVESGRVSGPHIATAAMKRIADRIKAPAAR